MSARYCIYLKDLTVVNAMNKERNRSAYVEMAVKFYIENKDIINRYGKDIYELKKMISYSGEKINKV